MPIIPWRGRWRMNFRNHRKIVVVDGQVAMTGSQNIGDEYAGVDQTLGVWQDTQLTLQGPIVSELQEIFLEDWYYASGQRLRDERFYPAPDTQGNQLAQLIPSGPDHPAEPPPPRYQAPLGNACLASSACRDPISAPVRCRSSNWLSELLRQAELGAQALPSRAW
jgi:phosphatidylserine/phosphatidylglycerophosphate/cardiolipin synthase-like enzyme